jgi:hypothetical protein
MTVLKQVHGYWVGKGRIPRVIVKFEPIIETCLLALTAAFT